MEANTFPHEAFKKDLAPKDLFDEQFKMIDEHFKRLNLKLNIFIVIFTALAFVNPIFMPLIEKLFGKLF